MSLDKIVVRLFAMISWIPCLSPAQVSFGSRLIRPELWIPVGTATPSGKPTSAMCSLLCQRLNGRVNGDGSLCNAFKVNGSMCELGYAFGEWVEPVTEEEGEDNTEGFETMFWMDGGLGGKRL